MSEYSAANTEEALQLMAGHLNDAFERIRTLEAKVSGAQFSVNVMVQMILAATDLDAEVVGETLIDTATEIGERLSQEHLSDIDVQHQEVILKFMAETGMMLMNKSSTMSNFSVIQGGKTDGDD